MTFAAIAWPPKDVAAQSGSPFQRPRASGRGSALESLWDRENATSSQRNSTGRPDHGPTPPRSHRPSGRRNYVQPIIQPDVLAPITQPQPATRSRASLQIINRAPVSDELPPTPEVDENPLLDVRPAPEDQAPAEAVLPLPMLNSPTPATAAMIKDGAEVIEQLDRQLRNQSEDEQRHLDSIRSQLQQLDHALTRRMGSPPPAAEPPAVNIVPEATPADPPTLEPSQVDIGDPSQPTINPLLPFSPGDVPPERRVEPQRQDPAERAPEPSLPPAFNEGPSFPDFQKEPAPMVPMESVQPAPMKPAAQATSQDAASSAPAPSLPSGDVVTSGAVDRLGLADSFYASGQLQFALQSYQELAPTLQGEDRVWVDYQIGNALRRLNKPKDAETVYREVASQSAPSWVVESARWWLKSLDKQNTVQQGVAQIDAQLEAS